MCVQMDFNQPYGAKFNILKIAVRAQCTSCNINILSGVTPVMVGRKCLCHNFDTTPVVFFFTDRFLCMTRPNYLYFKGKSSHVSSSPGCVMEVLDPTSLQINIQKLQLLCLNNLSRCFQFKGKNYENKHSNFILSCPNFFKSQKHRGKQAINTSHLHITVKDCPLGSIPCRLGTIIDLLND